jgi:hypothetical protein
MKTSEHVLDHCFRRLAGMERVFEPGCGQGKTGRKHPCPDCSFCQNCAETRCFTCRGEGNRGSAVPQKKLGFREQILLYEQVNSQESPEDQLACTPSM